MKNIESTPEKPLCSCLWNGLLWDVKQSLSQVIRDLDEKIEEAPWSEKNNHISMWRDKDGPKMNLSLFDDHCEEIATFNTSLDDFLDWTHEVYSCGSDGWGVDMIEDLEILKIKIQERIDRMKSEIESEN